MTAFNGYSDNPQDWVKAYYGEVLGSSNDLKTSACCVSDAPGPYLSQLLKNVHEDVSSRFYGCGFPFPQALGGATVVDLGCGTGRDVYVLSQMVGPQGQVIGVDMTPSQLEVAEKTRGWHMDRFGFKVPNVRFEQGYIEDLSVLDLEPGSVDVFVSNCVVNLSPRKDLVLQQVMHHLREGGEFYLSDVIVDRRLPVEVARDPVLYSECLGGAMYRGDFSDLCKKVGFLDPRIVSERPIDILNAEVQEKVGAARFYSVTYRLLKLPSLETRCEDYGQVATYTGGLPDWGELFVLDDHHTFERGRPERVCGNTADMLTQTRFAPHFAVTGTKERHYGIFDCGPTLAASQYQPEGNGSSACC